VHARHSAGRGCSRARFPFSFTVLDLQESRTAALTCLVFDFTGYQMSSPRHSGVGSTATMTRVVLNRADFSELNNFVTDQFCISISNKFSAVSCALHHGIVLGEGARCRWRGSARGPAAAPLLWRLDARFPCDSCCVHRVIIIQYTKRL
jgi:hypothetical protein